MSYSIYDETMNTVTGPTPAPTYTVSTTNNTSGGSLYWGMNGTSGSAGQVYTSNGTNNTWITATDPSLQGSTLHVKGNANFEGDVKIKGKDIAEMFDKIEARLAILHPNPELEDKWDELKELGKRYKELEAEIIEKEKVWSILKK